MGLTEAAIEWWGKAGLRSLERSALIEATEQFTHALAQIATLPGTAALRSEEIKLQVALITPLIHVKGYAAAETKAAAERAHVLIEQAKALGEPPEDPLLLFSVLYSFWVANLVAFNGDAVRELRPSSVALAEKQGVTVPLMLGHRLVATSLLYTGDFEKGRTHLDRAIAFYDPVAHRPLATRFGQDAAVSILCYRSWVLWFLGYPDAALADTEHALRDAREIGHAATSEVWALVHASLAHSYCGIYAAASAEAAEDVALANEIGSLFWAAFGTTALGFVSPPNGQSLRCGANYRFRARRAAANGNENVVPLYLSEFGRRICRNSVNSMTLGAALRKQE